jgi:hypothetical protein
MAQQQREDREEAVKSGFLSAEPAEREREMERCQKKKTPAENFVEFSPRSTQ